MRLLLGTLLAAACALLCGCGSSGVPGHSTSTQTGPVLPEWTWIAGSNSANANGVYGVEGTAAAGNTPGGRYAASTWTDASGNLWIFGGAAAPTASADTWFSDLWEFSGGLWTWKAGSDVPDQPGVYGSPGVPAASNNPGARSDAISWSDPSGNLWLFGGLGLDAYGESNDLNDLWKYADGQWTWIGGSNVADQLQVGVYGKAGVPAATNQPGARSDAVSWVDSSGNLWLYGGLGYGATTNWGYLGDLWKYVPSTGLWTWMAGSSQITQAPAYGIQGTPAAGNTPGSRVYSTAWTDAEGNLWLFGGMWGNPGTSGTPNIENYCSDLWKYANGAWTWVAGPSAVGQAGAYGTEGTAAAANAPSARIGAVGWTDSAGNFWLYGGDGYDSTGTRGALSDLWKFDGSQWTWMGGSATANAVADYGSLDMPATANTPGNRFLPSVWSTAKGTFYLFGGSVTELSGDFGYFNDLWSWTPPQ
jgi:hypothetical protein